MNRVFLLAVVALALSPVPLMDRPSAQPAPVIAGDWTKLDWHYGQASFWNSVTERGAVFQRLPEDAALYVKTVGFSRLGLLAPGNRHVWTTRAAAKQQMEYDRNDKLGELSSDWKIYSTKEAESAWRASNASYASAAQADRRAMWLALGAAGLAILLCGIAVFVNPLKQARSAWITPQYILKEAKGAVRVRGVALALLFVGGAFMLVRTNAPVNFVAAFGVGLVMLLVALLVLRNVTLEFEWRDPELCVDAFVRDQTAVLEAQREKATQASRAAEAMLTALKAAGADGSDQGERCRAVITAAKSCDAISLAAAALARVSALHAEVAEKRATLQVLGAGGGPPDAIENVSAQVTDLRRQLETCIADAHTAVKAARAVA